MMHDRQRNIIQSASNDFAMHPSAYSLCSTLLSSKSSSTKSCSLLVFVLTWSLTLLLISSCVGLDADITTHSGLSLDEQSFFDIQCKGVYNKTTFARLDQICGDCHDLLSEPKIHTLCRQKCFTTDYFKGCLDILHLTDENGKIQMWIKQLHGTDPRV